MDIDAVNYALLTIIDRADKPLWKKKIHTNILDQEDELPGQLDISVQTVGRRIDRLHDEAYLTSCITRPDGLKRDLIIAYKLTDQGVEALHQKREHLLREYVAAYHGIGEVDGFENHTENVFGHLITSTLAVPPEEADTIRDWPLWKLAALVQLYLLRNTVDEADDEVESLTHLLGDMDAVLKQLPEHEQILPA